MAARSLASSDRQAQHSREVARGERFAFGANWARFLACVDEARIHAAEDSLRGLLDRDSLHGLLFLDIGSGSGLFSLAARRLGADVHSFDYDPQSVACTSELRRRFFSNDPQWRVEHGSILDDDYVSALGPFDVVYSWGVLHHTGDMWRALDHARQAVRPGGQLCIALYNDMGSRTARWRAIKKTCNRLPAPLRPPFALLAAMPDELKTAGRAVLRGRPGDYVRTWSTYGANRGMSKWRDIVDWVGGYPYEAAKPDAVFHFLKARGFALETLRCTGGLGCNEYMFRRVSA